MKFRGVFLSMLIAALTAVACNDEGTKNPGSSNAPRVVGYEVVNTWPHASDAYTQGLIFHEGKIIESTGQEGKSSIRRLEIQTGDILQRVSLPFEYFGEGLTLLNGKLYQLTWQHKKGFIYDVATFQKLGEFNYYGEGWGLTDDEQSLILSDGTNRLRFIDPSTFQVKRVIAVADGGVPISQLNELEYVKGEILANVWHQDRIARIDPQSGKVLGWIDLKGLISPNELPDSEAVLNGIAYDEQSGRLFVTGKLWPKLFEIRIKKQ